MKTELTEFGISLNKQNVLRAVGCMEGSEVYDTVSRYFDELYDTVMSVIEPYAAVAIEDMTVYCVMTAGGGISDFSNCLFDSGEAVKGLLADAMADEYLFEMDKIITERIRVECAKRRFGVSARLDAPKDFPLSEQHRIIEEVNTSRVGVTDAFMLEPVKSMAYMLKLTDDNGVFNAQHDCSKCSARDCGRRNKPYKGDFEILSGYDYVPEMKDGESTVCIDIGTTTVVFELVTGGKTAAAYKTINPQRRFGLDVLSRIEAANRGRENELSSLIRYTLLRGYNEVTKSHGAPDKIIIAGNTTMVHLLMNYPCTPLGEYPFKSEHLSTINTGFDRITSHEAEPVETVICGGISAFVGGDIVSGLYMCDFDKAEEIRLFIDLGTNGEMAIGNKDRIIATSAAAGPAFEGGLISCGIGSVDGAVCGISLNPLSVRTIGDKPPVGICGTGIIELVSELLDNGIIDSTGLLSDGYFTDGYKIDDNIVFTQEDIRQVQTAKAAVRAGIECLIDAYGVRYEDISTVYLAGGFGYGLSVEKACNIGILPRELKDKTRTVGNSSLGGCVKFACEDGGDERIKRIQSISREFPLGAHKNFERLYLGYMNF